MSNTNQTTRVVTVSPKMAAAWLKRQELLVAQDPLMRNRTVKDEKVRLYAKDMAAGQWMVNGETLILASNGRILDGQHRLLACVMAQAPFRTHVVENVPHEAMRTIDTGVVRTMGDQLNIAGKVSGTRLSTALGVIWRWEQVKRKGFDWRARPTRLELFATLEQHPTLELFVHKSHGLERLMSGGLAAALWYVFAQEDATLADAFFDALNSGTDLRAGDPVFVLRERLVRERQQAALSRAKKLVTMEFVAEMVTRAWQLERRGLKVSKLQRGPRDAAETLLARRVRGARKVSA